MDNTAHCTLWNGSWQLSALLGVCFAVCKGLNQNRLRPLLFPLSLSAVPRVFEGSVVSEIKVPHAVPSPVSAELLLCVGWLTGNVSYQCWLWDKHCILAVCAASWLEKALVNVITVFYFLITLGFSNGRNVPFENKAEETWYANTMSQHEASTVTSDSQEQFPSFSSCRADEG